MEKEGAKENNNILICSLHRIHAACHKGGGGQMGIHPPTLKGERRGCNVREGILLWREG